MKKPILFILLFLLSFMLSLPLRSQDFNDFAERYVKQHNFSGTILVRSKDKIKYSGSFGEADRQFGFANNSETKYKIASVTKLFTSVLIMQLYEQGRLDPDAPLTTYLPAYRGEGGNRIRIRNLLNHTSGLPYSGPASKEDAIKNGMKEYQVPHTAAAIIDLFYSQPLVSEPGKVFSYNNGDYIILGKIIENLYGKPLSEILGQQILKPLGMKNSGLLSQYEIIPGLAWSYYSMNDSSGLVNDLPVYIENWFAAGAMYSNAPDLLRFSDALFSGRLLKPESLKLILSPGLDEYGFGLWVYEKQSGNRKIRVYKRPGDIMGTRSMFIRLPDEKVDIIMLANTDSADLDDFADRIMEELVK